MDGLSSWGDYSKWDGVGSCRHSGWPMVGKAGIVCIVVVGTSSVAMGLEKGNQGTCCDWGMVGFGQYRGTGCGQLETSWQY